MLSSTKSIEKFKNLQKRAVPFVLNDYESPNEVLLKNFRKSSIKLTHYSFLCVEAYKTLNNLNPVFMKDLFK